MGNKCGKSEAEYAKMTNDEIETWHWDTWIRYIPVANIAYGVARAGVYSGKAVHRWMSAEDNNNENANFSHGKEVVKSIFTAAGGVLSIVSSWYIGELLGAIIGHAVVAQLLKLMGEMIVGQLSQNIMTLIGDVVTAWKEYKMKNADEWEEIANSEAFKIPFIGFLYFVMRPWICKLIGKEDMDRQSNVENAFINILASGFGLGAAYGFYALSCHPSVSQFCDSIWERCQWADEFGRLFLAPSGWLRGVIQGMFPACGKGLGSATRTTLQALRENSKYTTM